LRRETHSLPHRDSEITVIAAREGPSNRTFFSSFFNGSSAQAIVKGKESDMPSAYLIVLYNEIGDASRLDPYSALADPAIEKAGGTILAKGVPARSYEAGRAELSVLVRFDTVEAAVALYESAEYRESLNVLGELNIRDVRIVAGM
jgi:uncharacterized protein (DUF1330 family)